MSGKKNIIILSLLITSIALLIGLQIFWLHSAYGNAEEDFRKETSLLFRSTIFGMQDSLIQRSILPMPGDSLIVRNKPRMTVRNQFRKELNFIDSLRPADVDRAQERIEVHILSDRPDSLGRIIRPLISKIRENEASEKFIIRLGPDSLSIDSIKDAYAEMLLKAGISTAFKIETAVGDETFREKRKYGANSFTSEVRLNPLRYYRVSFSGVEGFLIRKITPEILFCIFLTLITILSYVVLFKSLRSQQRLMQLKNNFISNVTHELKTPVATVSVALEAMKNFHALDNPQRTAEYLEIARQELNRLMLMTDKILKTAVFEEKGVELNFQQVDVHKLIQEVLASMKIVFEKLKVVVNYNNEGNNFFVKGSPEHLTNVIYNLVDNALKYGGSPPMITLILKEIPEAISIEVIDNGIGIVDEYQEKIFDKFFRVPSDDVHNIKGYGLGLSYVASVIDKHGGKISVNSKPSHGSVFTILLPKNR